MLLANKNGSGGIGYDGVAIFSSTSLATMLHEVGHAFVGLGDEYLNPDKKDFPLDERFLKMANLDTTDNLQNIKWGHMIGLEGYEKISAFEGGYYRDRDVWRPEENSVMRSEHMNPFFNAPSREAIVKKILRTNNVAYSFEKFLELDRYALDTIRSYSSKSLNRKVEINCGYRPD